MKNSLIQETSNDMPGKEKKHKILHFITNQNYELILRYAYANCKG